MKLTFKVPPGDLLRADRVLTQALCSIRDRARPCGERDDCTLQLTIEPSEEIAPSTREGEWPVLVQLIYEVGNGREIDLGSWDPDDFGKAAFEIAMKSEKEFRRLLAEPEAAIAAGESHEHL